MWLYLQRLMRYVMGQYTTFDELCGRQNFTLRREQVVRMKGKKRLLLCRPWGKVDCKNVKKQGRAEPLIDLGFELSPDAQS